MRLLKTNISWRVTALMAIFMFSFAGSWTDLLRSKPEQAQNAYHKGDYKKALELYQNAATREPDSDTLAYNVGNTQYSLGQYKEAAGQFARIMEKDKPALNGPSLYNLGNSLFQMGKAGVDQKMLEQALEAYRTSIRQNPSDEDSKYNYELTRRLIQKQQQQQQQNQDNKDQQKKDQDKKDQQQQKQNQDQQKKQDEKKQEQQQAEQQEQKQQQQKPEPQPGQMSKEEAERILNALMQMEKDMQEKEKKAAVQKRAKGPDW